MSLTYDIAGAGPTLVLVHGVVHRRQAWDPVLELLTSYRRVVTVDLPGHGESEDIDVFGAERLDAFVDALAELIRGIESTDGQVHVAGNSLGGYLSLCLAARGDVTTATALSPAGFWNGPASQARSLAKFSALRAAAAGLGKKAPAAFRSRLVRYPSLAPFFAHPSRISYDAAVVDLESLLTNTTLAGGVDAPFALPPLTDPVVPVTVAWGTRDFILPHRNRRNVLRHFPHARLISVPGVGHVPMSDNPELIASILLAGSTVPSADR
ncbi:hydrolase [Rhodococcoides trifolii]|uniref:Hydrolase n=1 Tax=Rhodococcoides trifolii TaxID=908250 RepID=A0A917G635_9NOCA|nr:alpha/beta fold hydrolase [Rhodococcus trifolii]GGG23661.1 hydrolase [Rhodococcus trifolii]